jgi:hypothetical protein
MIRAGKVNRNQQELIGAITHATSDQTKSLWVLRCKQCGYEYISNMNGFEERRCPGVNCQKGPVGLIAQSYRSA